MNASRRFTEDEVLTVLRQMWPRHFKRLRGKRPCDVPLTTLGDWDWEGDVDGLAFLFTGRRCEETFGFKATDEEWLTLATDEATVADFVRFIAARAEYRPIPSVAPLGRRCEQAGIFMMLEDATAEILGEPSRIGPSTPIRKVLRQDQLEKLMHRVQLHFPYIRSARNLWYRSAIGMFVEIGIAAAIGSTLIGILASWPHSDTETSLSQIGGLGIVGALITLAVLIVLLPVLLIGRWLLRMNTGPLSGRIKTFRDLVDILARQKINAFD